MLDMIADFVLLALLLAVFGLSAFAAFLCAANALLPWRLREGKVSWKWIGRGVFFGILLFASSWGKQNMDGFDGLPMALAIALCSALFVFMLISVCVALGDFLELMRPSELNK